MKFYSLKIIFCLFLFFLFSGKIVFALEPGTILYRTSNEGKMYGYSSLDLLAEKFGIISSIYPGHAAIYIGQEDGVDYVVEALSSEIVKTPAKFFINEAEGEEFVAAKLPIAATPWQRARAVALAKYLASADLAYDFDFSAQKGPWSGDWTCVGLTEKIYESANANNPERLGALEYNPDYYALDITPDGYDNDSFYNEKGDCFSTRREFSKIARRQTTILPAPEIIGYNAGKEKDGNRYIFLPYTQALQTSLKDVTVDIQLSSAFPDEMVRGKVHNLALILKWSLINNPVSSVKKIASTVSESVSALFKAKETTANLVWADETVVTDINTNPQVTTNKNISAKNISAPLVAEINPEKLATETNETTVVTPNSEEIEPIEAITKTTQVSSNSVSGPEVMVANDIFSAARPLSEVAVNSVTTSISPTTTTNKSVTTTKSNSLNSLNTISDNNVALWSPLVKTPVATTTNNASATSSANVNEVITAEPEDPALTLVLSRLYTEGNDDWLEIWNYGDQDIDLAARKIRLEKSRTALDPGIILRFDAPTDAEFPGGTLIRAGAPYRIVRDDASSDLKAAAHAIALRPDFTLMDNAYTLYLASGPVSSQDDADIIDILAYGEAKYFDGSGPAPALQENYLLRRKADSQTVLAEILQDGDKANWPPVYDNDDNANDFLLWPLGGLLPSTENEDNADDTTDNTDNTDNTDDTTDSTDNTDDTANNQDNSEDNADLPFTMQAGIDSPDLQYLWSFSECSGDSTQEMITQKSADALSGGDVWSIGRWGCGRRLSYAGDKRLSANLDPALSGSNFTFAFQYKGDGGYAHPYFIFSNTSEDIILRFDIFASMFEFSGFPGLAGRYDADGHMDNLWHQGFLIWNAQAGYWSLYLDGDVMFSQNFSGLSPDFDKIEIGALAGVIIVDDLALWNRALSEAEIQILFLADQPFNPQVSRNAPPNLQLKYAWNFDEISGSSAFDSVTGLEWSLSADSLVYTGLSGKALSYPPIATTYDLNIPELAINNFSASWWWQNNATLPYSGRLHLDFKQGTEKIAGFIFDNFKQRLWTGVAEEELSEEGHEIVPEDNLWHHLALVYDDYNYLWQFFVDGELKLEAPRLPLASGVKIDNLTFSSSVGDYKVDNFKIWQGSLDAAIVLSEYQAEKPE